MIRQLFRRTSKEIVPAEEDLGPDPWGVFVKAATESPRTRVLEVGTAQVQPGVSTSVIRIFPGIDRANYTMADVRPGPDVDVVADLHTLPLEWTGVYDAFVANAVFEHLERPWVAAKEVARILMPGGLCFVGTHQTWPLHGHPNDYFRFSKDALSLIFRDAGLEIMAAGYQHRCKIVPPPDLMPPTDVEGWNRIYPSYALVKLTARKPD